MTKTDAMITDARRIKTDARRKTQEDFFYKNIYLSLYLGCPRGVMVKAMDCGIVVSEFELQSRYYVHFRANTHGTEW